MDLRVYGIARLLVDSIKLNRVYTISVPLAISRLGKIVENCHVFIGTLFFNFF